MLSKKTIAAFVIVAALMVSAAAQAGDDVTPLVEKGRKAYAAGNYQTALECFQQVVQIIQANLAQSFEGFFPDALPGWTADDIESQSWTGTTDEGASSMTNLSREYRREDGTRCKISLSNWPHVVDGLRQSMAMYKQMGEMMNQDPNMKVVVDERDGWTILKIVDIEGNNTNVTALGDQMMLNIELSSKEGAIADEYLGKIDLKKLGGM